MEISVRDPHNDIIKPSENGGLNILVDSVIRKYLITDTTLRLFILPQVWKISPILRQICRCDICKFTKDVQVDLNVFRTKFVTN